MTGRTLQPESPSSPCFVILVGLPCLAATHAAAVSQIVPGATRPRSFPQPAANAADLFPQIPFQQRSSARRTRSRPSHGMPRHASTMPPEQRSTRIPANGSWGSPELHSVQKQMHRKAYGKPCGAVTWPTQPFSFMSFRGYPAKPSSRSILSIQSLFTIELRRTGHYPTTFCVGRPHLVDNKANLVFMKISVEK